MQVLDLSSQKIEILFSNSIKGNFEKLYLDKNLIGTLSIQKKSFGLLTNLVEISFSNNLIASLDFEYSFEHELSSIGTLNFESNKIANIKNGFCWRI